MVEIAEPKHIALIPAAGNGSRMGSEIPKQYLPLLGKPLIFHTLKAFFEHPDISLIAVILHPEDDYWDQYDWSMFSGKLKVLKCGGDTRAASVFNGLKMLPLNDDDWVLVHDAARPCISDKLISTLLAELKEDDVGGLLAIQIADTIKQSNVEKRVASTTPRDHLWQAQTPQMFRYQMLLKGLQLMGTDKPTDESQAIEFLGHQPKLVKGERSNLKVTLPEDLEMAKIILQARNNR